MAKESNRVAVIGLGAMGAALAAALLKSGATVRVWNRTPDKALSLHDLGAIKCATASESIAGSDTVIVCVSDYPAWRSLVDTENLGAVLADRTIIQLTTGTLDQVREHEQWAHQCGARLIDGSILCFPSQIGTDEATLLVAGALSTFDAVADVLNVFAADVVYLDDNLEGPVVLDMAALSGMLGMIVGVVHGAAMCRAGGVAVSEFAERMRRGAPVMIGEAARICEAIESGDTANTEASLRTWSAVPTDLQNLCDHVEIDTRFHQTLASVFQRALDRGLGEHDVSALVEVLEAGPT